MAEIDRKLFLGGRLKRLRRDLALTQTKMAEDLGVSPSYLNHLERNQRPVTAQVLLRLAQAYDLDLRSFTGGPEAGGEADLAEVFADPMFRDLSIPRHESSDLAENAPGAAEALVRLYRAFTDARRREALGAGGPLVEGGAAPAGFETTPADWVRDFLQARRNWFPDLDERGETLAAELGPSGWGFEAAAIARLKDRHGVTVRVFPVQVMVDYLRRYDIHRRRLMLSEMLQAPSRAFALAYQLAALEQAEAIAAAVQAADAPDVATRRLLKVAMTNYLAAAIMMPYAAFHEAAEALAYDISILAARFGASFEQAAHRLTTLSRPTARGVPFFLVRIDQAGNVSKRFASVSFPFSKFGGACPRWNVHSVFRAPGRVRTQIVETPDKTRFFTLSRTVERWGGGGRESADLALGLGCELKYAQRLVYAKGLDLAEPAVTEIGPTCRLCERLDCRERAAPPVTRTLVVDETSRSVSPFPFEVHR
jgi:predicted transcriptional regulator/DNA-binding XRE family transcriptional regulator